MIGAALIVAEVAMLAVSAGAWAACLRLRSLHAFLLSAYLAAWVELVLSSLLVSAFDQLSRAGLLASSAVWVVVAWGFWVRRGRPRPPSFLARCRWLGAAVGDRIELGLLVSVLGLGYAYLIALGLFTPQNDSDALTYHLSRAALWRQNGHIGVSDYATEHRMDKSPIVAEIGDAATLILAGSERFVWIVQLSAVGALALGAFALARRVGLSARGALVGATVVPALPVIATQAVTGYNDLVVASFVVGAAVFVLGRERAELAPLLVAVALAVGTKFITPFLLPTVALVGLLGQPRRRWPGLAAAGLVGVVVGGGWYVVNLVRTGELHGGVDIPGRTAVGALEHLQLLILGSVEVPGGDGWGAAVFLTTGLACALAVMTRVPGRRLGNEWLVGGLLLAVTPLAMVVTTRLLGLLFGLVSEAIDEPEFARAVRAWRPSTVADGSISWYGPLGAALGAAVIGVSIHRARKGTLSRAAIALGLAPWIGAVIVAVAIPWTPWHGRYLVAGWVMSVALWGLVTAAHRWLAATVSLVTTLTFVLSLVGYAGKPIGIPVLYTYDSDSRSIWSLQRWEAQTLITRESGEQLILREVERRVPDDDTIAVTVPYDGLLFPYFGRDLRRIVLLVDDGEPIPASAGWSVASPTSAPLGCTGAWQQVFAHKSGWRLYARTAADRCAAVRRLRPG